MRLRGIHHVTAVSAKIQENHDFYTRTMGMRLVKRSVNQDDVSAYHLFYADSVGTPGTDLTFFDWKVPREQRGTHSINGIGLRVAGEGALEWWAEHLTGAEVTARPAEERDGRMTIPLEDGEGQRLLLIDDGNTGDPSTPWDAATVPPDHQIRGLGPIFLSVPDVRPTAMVLEQVMDMEPARSYRAEGRDVEVFAFPWTEGPHGEVHVAIEPDLPIARPGAGGVHHVAFRVADEEYEEWSRKLNAMRVRNSGPVDRYYFRSLYFREPNGILFELATDGPGFGVDEDMETLGESVVLPPFLEARRDAILAGLTPIES